MILLDTNTITVATNSLILGSGGPGGKTLNGNTEIVYRIEGRIRPPISDATTYTIRPRVAGVTVPGGAAFSNKEQLAAGAATVSVIDNANDWHLETTTTIGADAKSVISVVIEIQASATLNANSVNRGYRSKVTQETSAAGANVTTVITGTWTGAGQIDGFELIAVPGVAANGFLAGTEFSVFTPLIKPTSP